MRAARVGAVQCAAFWCASFKQELWKHTELHQLCLLSKLLLCWRSVYSREKQHITRRQQPPLIALPIECLPVCLQALFVIWTGILYPSRLCTRVCVLTHPLP